MKKIVILLTGLLFFNVGYAGDILEGSWKSIKIDCTAGTEDITAKEYLSEFEFLIFFKDGSFETMLNHKLGVTTGHVAGQYFINENILTQINLEIKGPIPSKITKIAPYESYFTQFNGGMVLIQNKSNLCKTSSLVLTMVRIN